MREISIIVENSVCLVPAAQGRHKLFPRSLFEGLGGTTREINIKVQGRHKVLPRTLFQGLGGTTKEINIKAQDSDLCFGHAAAGLISCSPERCCRGWGEQ